MCVPSLRATLFHIDISTSLVLYFCLCPFNHRTLFEWDVFLAFYYFKTKIIHSSNQSIFFLFSFSDACRSSHQKGTYSHVQRTYHHLCSHPPKTKFDWSSATDQNRKSCTISCVRIHKNRQAQFQQLELEWWVNCVCRMLVFCVWMLPTVDNSVHHLWKTDERTTINVNVLGRTSLPRTHAPTNTKTQPNHHQQHGNIVWQCNELQRGTSLDDWMTSIGFWGNSAQRH